MIDPRGRNRWSAAAAAALAAVVLLGLGACASTSDADAGGAGTSAPAEEATMGTTSTTEDTRPPGPSSVIDQRLEGGAGVFIGTAEPGKVDEGYVEEEYLATGTASAYVESGERTADGRWTLEPGDTADYRTRIVVRRPADADDASGVVLVEWLNVSGGVDADPEFVTLREEIVRQGHTWVGVSAQAIGVEGGPVAVKVDVPGAEAAGQGLKKLDPERYGTLQHPGDAYAFDLYTQVARSLRAGGPALGGIAPSKVAAVGESQSAFALVTYINGVQPLTQAFDGFFVHSRGGAGLSIAPPGQGADMTSSIGGVKAIFRTDTTVPIFDLQTENDLLGVLGSAPVRQPDTDLIRLWEVAGTAHADLHLTGEATAEVIDCGLPINDGPLHLVAKAGLRHFVQWIEGGEPPPIAPRIELTAGDAEVARDVDGIALGGVRTPPVDLPVRVLSGVQGPNPAIICLLSGSTKPMAPERIAELHPSRSDFEQRYAAAMDETIAAGFIVAEDRDALEAYGHAELVPE